jgi:hypothetical protein
MIWEHVRALIQNIERHILWLRLLLPSTRIIWSNILIIIQVNVYPYIRQVGSMESTKILFSSTDIWVMDYTVTVIVNKFITWDHIMLLLSCVTAGSGV